MRRSSGRPSSTVRPWRRRPEDEHPELHQEREREPHVPDNGVHGGQPGAPRERSRDGRNAKSGSTAAGPGTDPGPREHREQHAEGEREIDERREHRRERHGQPREVDLRHQRLVHHHALAARGHGAREELPGHQRAEGRDRVGDPRRAGHPIGAEQRPEQPREDRQREQRLEHGPGHTQRRLLVADLEVAQGEEGDQLAVAPESGRSRGTQTVWG